jgi:Pregnancy-associated plasma protein-A
LSAPNSGPWNQLLVHEVGHWLGLPHTFAGWNPDTAPEGGCTPPGDGIDDTPAEASPAFGCLSITIPPFLPRDTCPEPGFDPVDNYMAYVPDICMYKFTDGQRAAMRAAWFNFRAPAQPVPVRVPIAVLPLPVPTNKPVHVPTDEPAPVPTDKPVPAPTDKPVLVPTAKPVPVPVKAPAPVPVKAPVPVPVMAMLPVPVVANAPVPVPVATMMMKTMGMKEMGMNGMGMNGVN